MNGPLERAMQDFSTLTRVLVVPSSNMRLATLLYTTIGVFLLLILVIGLMIIMGAPEPQATGTGSRGPSGGDKEGSRGAGRKARTPLSPRTRLLVVAAVAAALLVVWVAAGFTTSDTGLCKSCHWPSAQHAKAAKGADPHSGTDCVSCHEGGGVVRRYATGVPLRVLHMGTAWAHVKDESGYGGVASRSCSSCHAAAMEGTKTDVERGLRMSHAEPIAASALCVDCHTLRAGVVGLHNAGMDPCLRCHDGTKVSAACATCHEEKAATAARPRTTALQSVQIQDVKCSGCHNEKRDCDPCHGLRMPHTSEFMNGAHARAAVVDIWYGGGKACGRCHTATRHPCTQCHSSLMGKAHGGTDSMARVHQRAIAPTCDSCHSQYAPIATRDFCKDVCHSTAAREASPR